MIFIIINHKKKGNVITMPSLNCDVSTCTHNSAGYCCKQDICVGGDNAVSKAATCCTSFAQKADAGCTSCACGDEVPQYDVAVGCDATNCTYNCAKECTATNIKVCGANACDENQTECETFCCK